MNKQPAILLVYPHKNEGCKIFAETLKDSLFEWKVTLCEAKVSTLLLQARKADLLHILLPPGSNLLALARKVARRKSSVHTIVAPHKNQNYADVLCSKHVVVFTQQQKTEIERSVPGVSVDVIAPCKGIPADDSLHSAAHLREKYQVGDRFLAIALTDVTNRPVFDAFLYICREYNRRGGFRFLIPLYDEGKETKMWRGRLEQSIQQERLTAVTLLDSRAEGHALLFAADLALHLQREPDRQFGLSLAAMDYLLLGKPVICFNQPALNELIGAFQRGWVANNIEDVVRASRDLRKNQSQLPQLSAQLTRYAEGMFSPENVASQYQALYHQVVRSSA